MIIEPSVGRIVHFKTLSSERNPDSIIIAAIITAVLEDGSVNISCFMPKGGLFYRKGVVQGDGEGQWSYPVIKK